MTNLKVNIHLQKPKSRILAITVAAVLMISVLAPLTLLQTASAHTPAWTLITNAYIYVPVNPIGVNQGQYIYIWLDRAYDGAALTNDYRFHNYNFTAVSPSGKITKTIVSTTTDPTSNKAVLWTPTEVGTYTLYFTFPGQNINDYSHASDTYVNDTYLSSSTMTTVTVQQTPIDYPINSYPIPTEYWTRPIYGENNYWWSISSNWLGSGAGFGAGYGGLATSYNTGGNGEAVYPGDAVGPQTSHVMWTAPLQFGGVVGGNNYPIQGNTYFEGSAYNQRFTNPIIVYGRLYYTEPVSFTGTTAGPTKCVDIRTGEVIWSRTDVPALSGALIWDHEDPNQHGVYPALLYTASFARVFDAYTGDPLFNVTGVPSGFVDMGPNAEQVRYVLANAGNTSVPDWRLGEWNSTKLWNFGGLSPLPAIGNGTTVNVPVAGTVSRNGIDGNTVGAAVLDGSISNPANSSCRYDWNVSIPWRNTMRQTPTVLYASYNDFMLCLNGTFPSEGGQFMGTLGFNPYTYFLVNLNPKNLQGYKVGDIIWMRNYDPPPNNITVLAGGVDLTNRVFIENWREILGWVGYSLDTGDKLWGPTPPQASLDYYGSPGSGSLADALADGKLISSAYAGIVYCYDTSDGSLLWTYGNGGVPGNNTNSGFAVPGGYPTFVQAIGNGIVYTYTCEHTVEAPIYKGALMRAINETTGKEIWTLSNDDNEFMSMSFAMADGYIATFNSYDNQIYSVGRGPSQTTVLIRSDVITLGHSALIQGTVTDISAGTKQDEQAARFPNGVPAVADESMDNYMGYVYQHKEGLQKDAKGVTVEISEMDSNNNYYVIGNATTDANGMFKFMWQPPITGAYTIYAKFLGTNGYWPSSAETVLAVEAAPSPVVVPTATPTSAPTITPPPTEAPTASPSPIQPTPPTNPGISTEAYVAIAAVIIIAIVAAIALILRRRK